MTNVACLKQGLARIQDYVSGLLAIIYCHCYIGAAFFFFLIFYELHLITATCYPIKDLAGIPLMQAIQCCKEACLICHSPNLSHLGVVVLLEQTLRSKLPRTAARQSLGATGHWMYLTWGSTAPGLLPRVGEALQRGC